MTGHIFIHVGPPKTATTSLQLSLQELEGEGVHYVGVRQPRATHENIESDLLIQVSRGDPTIEGKAQRLRASFVERLQRNETIIVSEEMFVVAANEEKIRIQLANLATFFRGLPLTIVVTLRDPRQAIPSYYQEVFRSLPLGMARDFRRFVSSGQAFCYDYESLCSFIDKLGVPLWLVDFRELTGAEVKLETVLGPDCPIEKTLSLSRSNESKIADKNSERHIPGIDLSILARTGYLKMIIDALGLRHLPGWTFAGRIARNISINTARHRSLALRSADEKYFMESFEAARARLAPAVPRLEKA